MPSGKPAKPGIVSVECNIYLESSISHIAQPGSAESLVARSLDSVTSSIINISSPYIINGAVVDKVSISTII